MKSTCSFLIVIAIILPWMNRMYCQTNFNILFLYTTDDEPVIARTVLKYLNEFYKAELGEFSIFCYYHKVNNNLDSLALNETIASLNTPPRKHIVLGTGTISETMITAIMIGNYFIPQILYKNAPPGWNRLGKFGQLIKLYPPGSFYADAIINILFRNNWKIVSTLEYDNQFIHEVSKSFQQTLVKSNLTLSSSYTYIDNATRLLNFMKTAKARIIIHFPNTNTPTYGLECSVYNENLYGPLYQWLIIESVNTNSSNCPLNYQQEVLKGAIYLRHEILDLPIPSNSVGGQTFINYLQRNVNRSVSDMNFDNLMLIDSLWMIYLAFNNTRPLHNKTVLISSYSETRNVFEMLVDHMAQIDFVGLTGSIKFNHNRVRLSKTSVYQFMDNKLLKRGSYNPETKILSMNSSFWFANGVPPKDSVTIVSQVQMIPRSMYYVFVFIMVIVIIVVIVFIAINVKFRNLKLIKMSSPNLNNLLAVGVVGSVLSILPIGYSLESTENVTSKKWICQLRIWLLLLSFDFVFGSLFSKTWRIHMIFAKNKMHKKTVIKDFHLFIMIAGIVIVDVLVLLIWELIDQIQWCTFKEKEVEIEGVITESTYILCCSKYGNYFKGVLFSMKGVLLLVGMFFAWETRKVHIDILNDSKQACIAIYIVIIMSIVIIPLHYIIDQRQIIASFFVLASTIIICSSTTLILVFIPKFLKTWHAGIKVDHKIETFNSNPA